MLNFFKKKNKPEEDGLIEYTFIWYKEMKNGNSTNYTAPFRTKVRAKTKQEAVDKVTEFALGKMKLVVFEEKDFKNTNVSKMQEYFNDVNKGLNQMFDKFNKL